MEVTEHQEISMKISKSCPFSIFQINYHFLLQSNSYKLIKLTTLRKQPLLHWVSTLGL